MDSRLSCNLYYTVAPLSCLSKLNLDLHTTADVSSCHLVGSACCQPANQCWLYQSVISKTRLKISRYSEVINLKLHLDTHWFLRLVNLVFIYEGNKIKGWNARSIKCIAQLEKLIKNFTLVTEPLFYGGSGCFTLSKPSWKWQVHNNFISSKMTTYSHLSSCVNCFRLRVVQTRH